MNAKAKPIILIPARMKSERLPNKPLAGIDGKPMILRVMEKAISAGIGRVVVAVAEKEIADIVTKAGGEAVLTDPSHPSGTDRIFEALQKIDPGKSHDVIINLQGDLPTIDPKIIKNILGPVVSGGADVATLIAKAAPGEEENPNVVKAVVGFAGGINVGRALYFTRSKAPFGEGPFYHHIGIYAYTRAALERFVSLAPSSLEKREKLEQLRALENGMRIDAVLVDTVPLGVDTAEDLEMARKLFKGK